MVNIQRLILSLPWLHSEAQTHEGGQISFQTTHEFDRSQSIFASVNAPARRPSKSIAIIGAGSCGLTSLRTFLDVAESTNQDWEIVLFEERADVGGIWFPEEKKPRTPIIPATPLHKYLRMNSPHPMIAHPHFPFPPMTKLLPNYDAMWQYHLDFAAQYNLTSYIRFNHTVTAAAWNGNSTEGFWNLTVTQPSRAPVLGSSIQVVSEHKTFDHLVVAIGIDHFPHSIELPGIDDWLSTPHSSGRERKVLHSVYHEGPEEFENRTVLVVGGGPSGADVMLHTTPAVRKIYWSFKDPNSFIVNVTLQQIPPWHDLRPAISHFTTDQIVAATRDQTTHPTRAWASSPTLNTISPCTSTSSPSRRSSLGLLGLIGPTPRFYITVAQTLYLAYAIIDPGILPSREEMLKEVHQREERHRGLGVDPYLKGHHFPEAPGEAFGKGVLDYMEELVQYLKDRHVALPYDNNEDGLFVDRWRRETFAEDLDVVVNWLRIVERGEEEMSAWLRDVETEEEWVELVHRVARWNGD